MMMFDDPAHGDEQMYKRLVRALPAVGDSINLDEDTVVVTRVSLRSPRTIMVGSPVALVYCRLK